MRRNEENGIVWMTFELLLQFPKLKHGIFLRHGGVSSGEFSTLNASYSVGDDENAVIKNRKKIQNAFDLEHLVSATQVHGNQLEEISLDSINLNRTCDGLTTNIPDIGLMVLHADCQAAIFYDPINHALANVHSGWRGSVQNIYQESILKMNNLYGTDPRNLHVAISPSLGPEKAEFINYKVELPKAFWDFQEKPYHFNFWEISRMQLQKCGVLPHHIEIAEICTYSNPKDYFSYRRKKISGRHGTLASLLQ